MIELAVALTLSVGLACATGALLHRSEARELEQRRQWEAQLLRGEAAARFAASAAVVRSEALERSRAMLTTPDRLSAPQAAQLKARWEGRQVDRGAYAASLIAVLSCQGCGHRRDDHSQVLVDSPCLECSCSEWRAAPAAAIVPVALAYEQHVDPSAFRPDPTTPVRR